MNKKIWLYIREECLGWKSWEILWLLVAYGFLLRRLGGALPFVDAFSTVVSAVAMLISVKMYAEQWMLWIVVDVVTVIMWAVSFAKGNDSVATLLMWIVYLVNAVVMYVKWKKEAKQHVV